jgi:anti-sigma regulatory factor (Ser/Thr protein kinase)
VAERELQLVVPAKPEFLREVRLLVKRFVLEAGGSERVDDVVLAVHEACSSVVTHAYGKDGGPLHLQAWREAESLVVEVSDNGTPVADPNISPAVAIGLSLINDVCDEVDIEGPGEYGTRLEMTFILNRPTRRH